MIELKRMLETHLDKANGGNVQIDKQKSDYRENNFN